MKPRVYIDGHAGTTGLRVREWLARRHDIDLLLPPNGLRKDLETRRTCMGNSDLTVLCLPDDAAREAANDLAGQHTRILDASTAHRTAEGWAYGLPELAHGQRLAIRESQFVSNPGCYPSAFILLVRPLVESGVVTVRAPLVIHGLSGYSGGGRALVERWEDPALALDDVRYEAPYALERVHKHVPEMMRYTSLASEPYFLPAVGAFRCGMRVQVPLHAGVLDRGHDARAIWNLLDGRYRDEPFVRVLPYEEPVRSDERSFDPQSCNDTNRIDLRVLPHPSGHVLLMAILDNLGKGAAGVAIQNINLMLGLDETAGLSC